MKLNGLSNLYTYILFCILCFNFIIPGETKAQDSLFIQGIVLSGPHKPLANVSVSVEGSHQLPVVTSDSGSFSIKVANINAWLVVSAPSGYKPKRVYLNKRIDLTIVLTPIDIFSGDDELTILNHPVSRKDIISAYTDLNLKNSSHSTSLSAESYMQGMLAGVNLVTGSGMPGSGSFVNIRGINSINANTQPLYVVDGVPAVQQGIFNSSLSGFDYNQLIAYNPFDISRLTVIKDPLITANYGTNGSNGLVIIETLDPKATQTTIDIDLRAGLSFMPTEIIPQLDAGLHRTLMQEVLFSSGLFEEDIREIIPSLYYTPDEEGYINYQHNTNWQNLIFSNASFKNVGVNIKGGDEIARYGLSFGYNNYKGIIKKTDFQGYNLRFVGKINVFSWLKMDAGVALNYGAANLKESAQVSETSPILAALSKSPLLGPYQYDLSGNQITDYTEVDYIGVSNPLAIIENYNANNHNYNFIASAAFEASINKYTSVKTKIGFTYNVLKEAIFMPNHGMERYYNGEAINVSKGSNNDIRSFYNNTYLYYIRNLGKTQIIRSSTGVNIQSNEYQFDFALTKNANENDKFRTLQSGLDNLREIGGKNRSWNWLSYYENISYSLLEKYFLSGSVSLDMSSRLGKEAINTVKIGNVPFGLFYSIGGAWRISSESFLKNLPWLEDFKLRVSYGKSGNSDIGEANATNYYKAIKFRETVGLYPNVVPNDKLSFETTTQLNTGIDLSLWGNRVTASLDIFNSKTSDLLIYTPVEAYLGYDFRAENGGALTNIGYDISAFMRLLDFKDFKWDVLFNFSQVKNKITEIKGDKVITTIDGAEIVNTTGSAANSFYGYIFKGVYATQREAETAGLVNNKGYFYQAGDAIFEDISGPEGTPDKVINEYDKTVIGSAIPEYYGGFANTFTYKNWKLSAFVQFVGGNEVFNYVRSKNESMSDLRNQSLTTANRWQKDGQITSIPRALYNDYMGNSAFSSRWIEDGAYVRLKNVTFSYTVPDKILVFRNGEVYITVINILTKTKYLGYDPEFAYSFDQRYMGVDYGLMPQPRQFIFGVRLGL